RTFGMLALRVTGVRQSLGDDVVGISDVVGCSPAPFLRRISGEPRSRGRQILVACPGEAAMVDDHVMRAADGGNAVRFPTERRLPRASDPDPYMLDDDVVRPDVDAAADQRDSRRRRGLTSNGQIGLFDRD